eukprot:s4840_g2.t1
MSHAWSQHPLTEDLGSLSNPLRKEHQFFTRNKEFEDHALVKYPVDANVSRISKLFSMSPIKDKTVRQLKLHVRLQAPGPGERFAVLGSHEALGCWNPTSGLHLEWKGNAWETPDPISISPCERVEFKFVRVWFGGVEWESGPNRVTEFPNFKGDLCLQGIFNGESILQPNDTDVEVPVQNASAVESIHHEDEYWKRRYEEALSVLMALQKDITSRQEEHERRRTRHHQVVNELRQQISAAQDEAEQLSDSFKEGPEKDRNLQSNLAPDTATIPSPSFASSASWQSTPARSVGKSSTSSLRRNPGLHFKSQRGDFQGKSSQGATGPKAPMPSAPAPPRGPIGRLSSVLESMHKDPGASAGGTTARGSTRGTRSSSKSETALAALRAARGASPVSPPSEDETLQSPQPSGAQSTHEMRTWSRSESGLRGSSGKYERVSSTGAEAEAEALDEGIHTVIASKEVVAALATAKARYDEVGSREDSR